MSANTPLTTQLRERARLLRSFPEQGFPNLVVDAMLHEEAAAELERRSGAVLVPVSVLKALYASYALEDIDRKKCNGGTWPRDRTESHFDSLLDDIGVGAKYRDEAELRSWLTASPPAQDSPFPNCKYRMCDLPGQCLSEGKCHHPRQDSAAQSLKDNAGGGNDAASQAGSGISPAEPSSAAEVEKPDEPWVLIIDEGEIEDVSGRFIREEDFKEWREYFTAHLREMGERLEAAQSQKSAGLCMYCGKDFQLSEYGDSTAAVYEAVIAHDAVCQKNPLVQELDRINRVGATKTVDNWLALSEADKRKWFATTLRVDKLKANVIRDLEYKLEDCERDQEALRERVRAMEIHHKQCPAFRGEQACECDANYAFAALSASPGARE